jgi:hypothetical protein
MVMLVLMVLMVTVVTMVTMVTMMMLLKDRNTILGLTGSLPKMAFDTTTITLGQGLASFMFHCK